MFPKFATEMSWFINIQLLNFCNAFSFKLLGEYVCAISKYSVLLVMLDHVLISFESPSLNDIFALFRLVKLTFFSVAVIFHQLLYFIVSLCFLNIFVLCFCILVICSFSLISHSGFVALLHTDLLFWMSSLSLTTFALAEIVLFNPVMSFDIFISNLFPFYASNFTFSHFDSSSSYND